ncbi:HAMP domain-containing protein [Pseudonocardia sp. KRD-184]|uniref:histidine kinase n=1 Tax=Pseudonocardia oceani TaxID=2792013 RepID=A0ABS6UC78_9PSEU|nr:ATP-binding protein [Pseudonocardia oceani]MBW0091835.1 HAMP domain-containing protein [Pseudonocardia oceani]MBW0097348.1 HAMP domain-containing protein [Pseudonocardia oceani]MBW0111221.1 HAMP domain-containing protein [Pseudonocardia oceani]MBW0123810.1 HAMP domain-containing protein [Pseudonocardia oceani]MBW0129827.1 HAMP domain-containing protein [Pseudonocardia oceani]
MNRHSLRARVTALSLLVLALVLLVVGVLTDVVFTAQSRADLRSQLTVRAALAAELVGRGVATAEIARQVETPGIRAVLVAADGEVYGDRRGRGRGGDDVLRQPLADGSQLTLVAVDDGVTSAQQRLRRTLFLLSVGGLAVAGVVMLLTTRVALAPLDGMTALARSITRGDRGRRLAPARTDTELGRTAAAFDAMLDELEGAERQARESEARTRRFVADAAHELRTPLAGVQAVAEAAAAPGLGAEERDRLHLLLLRESQRAGRLVDDLLVLARLDAGLELRREPVELLALAGTEAERVRMRAPGREITVSGEAVTVAGDPVRLAQVLANLLDNAHRYAPVDTAVAVRVGPGARVEVADAGPGVPPAERERIFDRLVRLDEARTAHDGGAGLGLAIARGIARAHGGELRLAEQVGAGAVFVLTLPA